MMNTNGRMVRAVGVIAGVHLFLLAATRLTAQDWRTGHPDQVPPLVVQTNNLGTLAPREVGETAETSDLGPQVILQRRPQQPLFSVYSDTQYLYDSNVGLTPNHGMNNASSDEVFFQTFGASFTPHLVDGLTSALYARQQFVRYDQQSILDFDAQSGGLSLGYPVGNWFTVYGGFEASRLFTRQKDVEFYKDFDTQFGLWRSQPLGQRLLFYYGYQLDWLPAHPSDLTELDDALYGGINLQLIDRLAAQFLYRFRVRNYLQTSRTDLDHLVSLALSYPFNRYISVRVYVSYGENDSNKSEFDYHVVNAGGGLNLSASF
ncbi:MAG: outer membrane beta-barrel protein [Verrucomicrobiia bacterium]|jgi:hypothetical protein